MSTVLDALRKRSHYAVKEVPGVFVRAMTRGEIVRMKALEQEAKTDFFMGCCLVDANGGAVFTKDEAETDVDFCARIGKSLADVDAPTVSKISEAIGRIGKVPDQETIAKNSEETRQPA